MLVKDYRKRPTIEDILRSDCITEKMRLYGYTVPSSEELKIKKTSTGQPKRPGEAASTTPTTGGRKSVPPR
jgi:hypothetical protein